MKHWMMLDAVKEFKNVVWLDKLVVNIWEASDLNLITAETYFLHLRDFSYLRFLHP